MRAENKLDLNVWNITFQTNFLNFLLTNNMKKENWMAANEFILSELLLLAQKLTKVIIFLTTAFNNSAEIFFAIPTWNFSTLTHNPKHQAPRK